MAIVVPTHLKNIFKIQNLDNHITLIGLTNEDILLIQEFLRSDVYKSNIPSNINLIDYYGIYSVNPKCFELSIGEKVMIFSINKFCIEKPLSYWKDQDESLVKRRRLDKGCDNCSVIFDSDESIFLQMLLKCKMQNKLRKKEGNRYEYSLKLLSSYLYLIGGPMLYETLQSNLPMPSLTTVKKLVFDSAPLIQEGFCPAEELKDFLTKRNLPLLVWISEDATRINNKVQYDLHSNQLVGFVLLLDGNSMPIANSFLAMSAKVMQDHFHNNPVSSLLYVYMAQPLAKNAPSFCLSIFGNCNSFVTSDVLKRWEFISEKHQEQGICILGFSSDGDTRLFKAMRIKSNIGIKLSEPYKFKDNLVRFHEFHASFSTSQLVVQDTVHIGTKLRNRFITASIVLPMGNFIISNTHLKILMDKLSKDKHSLRETDLHPKDKMNFGSVLRLQHPKVRNLIALHVPHSDATQEYLKIIFYVINSYLSTTLTASQRLYLI